MALIFTACGDRDPNQYVGIQRKLKSDGKTLLEKEVRTEIEKRAHATHHSRMQFSRPSPFRLAV